MSRATVSRWASGTTFEAHLERDVHARANALDRLLAEQAGWWVMHALALGAPARLAQSREVLRRAQGLQALDDAAFDRQVATLRASLRERGPQGETFVDAQALVCEASRRSLGKLPYAVQVLAANELMRGRIVEMATGEGKSLTAALAAALLACCGVPVDIFTVNDYLAQRDAAAMHPLFARLGLSVAAVDGPSHSPQRRAAYAADIVYLVNKDAVFEYLRHRQSGRRDAFAGRGLFFAIVDEADSILIDEARTPLILAREQGAEAIEELQVLLALARRLRPDADFRIHGRERGVDLLEPGREALQQRLDQLSAGPRQIREEQLEQALCALHLYRLDHDYVLRDGKVQIVDEFTGRILADRTWQRGLHQFIELKEGLQPTRTRETIASLTYPQFFRRYLRVSGMSGTVAENAGELRRNYGAQVLKVPTHRPVQRQGGGPAVHVHSSARWAAVVTAARDGVALGHAVLIGTRSVQASETIAARLGAAGIDHVVLNARQDAEEAAIVAEAGLPGRVTVATNMAGRGTDILIHADVRAAGGLLVILTEFHESPRVDRQLFGRCARQGDPGLTLAFASLEDEMFTKYLPPGLARMAQGMARNGTLPGWCGRALLRLAQGRASAHQRRDRDATLARDESLHEQLGFVGETA